MRGKDRGKAKADRRERGNMGVMSEMLNFGMGRPGDDDMNFHDLEGEGFPAEASEACPGQVPCTACGNVDLLRHAEGVCSEQRLEVLVPDQLLC